MSLYTIAFLGAYIHWLLCGSDLTSTSRSCLGAEASELKVPRQNRASELPDPANELRILRRLRHPSIVLSMESFFDR